MKLREFVPSKIERSPKQTRSYLLINLKYGQLQFSGAATDLMGIKDGDHISFHQDESDPASWYIELLPEKSGGFTLHGKGKPGVRGLIFACKSLVSRIADSAGMEDYRGKVTIAKDSVSVNGKTLWVLVTASLKPKRLD